ncbi:MAG: phosphonoacetaldehyde reductase [Muribaculaceae bacterium]|nr:phosphonoacetaldehyde reductase [Muribaculaceae bacterium]
MTEQQHIIAPGAISDPSALLARLKPGHILLVTGKASFEKCGAAAAILPMLKQHGFSVTRFCDFDTNPDTEGLARGLASISEIKPDAIIAVGGGSTIDMAKLIRFFHAYSGEILSGKYTRTAPLVPLTAIPTTAGTGSEATHFAVLYHKGIKHSIEHDDIRPDYAIVDATLTYGSPAYLTACAGFDALAQAIEAYWNRNATDSSDALALKAIELLYPALPHIVTNPDDYLRRRHVAEGAYWAGRAIDITKTTAPHAFSYPFTSHYGYPHGHAVALTFPLIAEINISRSGMPDYKKDYLRHLFGTSDKIAEVLGAYTHSIGLALRPDNYDIDLISSEINLGRLANNPAEISPADAGNIILQATTTL